jgi:hypothetical protein
MRVAPQALASRRRAFGDASRALAVLLGAISIALAIAVWATGSRPGELAVRVEGVLGPIFIAGIVMLTLLSIFAGIRVWRNAGDLPWLAAGLQAASGIATLALTFTLLGIGLGIASLSEAEISPETVNGIIADLTGRFALAFSTTVVGLPLAAVLRAVLLVLAARSESAVSPGRVDPAPVASGGRP